MTFRDIWQDYKNFKEAYYYEQVIDLKKEATREGAKVDVDFSKFSLPQKIWDASFYGMHQSEQSSASRVWANIFFMFNLIAVGNLGFWVHSKYFDYEDPLKKL